ncbi:hypothetical protein P692DRAFT_201808527, partial [Suillus brevipes Sb2]
LERKTLVYVKEMGTTGAGIECEEDINMSQVNNFTTRWAQIKEEFPWFFEMRALVANHPSRIPTGIGNADSAADFSILLPNDGDEFSESLTSGEDVKPPKHQQLTKIKDLADEDCKPAKKLKVTTSTKPSKTKSFLDSKAKAKIKLEKERHETEKERRKTEYALRKLELEHQFRTSH